MQDRERCAQRTRLVADLSRRNVAAARALIATSVDLVAAAHVLVERARALIGRNRLHTTRPSPRHVT
jgi:hypothetical protein